MSPLSPHIGDVAPAFTLPRDGGEEVSLSQFAGRSVVLFFYPRDDTSGCTREAVEFSEASPLFEAADTAILGISTDSVKSHVRFRDKHGLTVPLLSDENAEVANRFGTWVEKSMYGRKFMGVERSTFLIGPDGVIRAVWRKVKVPGHVEDVLKAAQA